MRSERELRRGGSAGMPAEIEELCDLSEVLALGSSISLISERSELETSAVELQKRAENVIMDQSRIHGFYPPQMDRSTAVCSSVTSSFLDSTSTSTAENGIAAAAATTNFDFDTTNPFSSFSQHLSSFPLHLYNASHGMGLSTTTGVGQSSTVDAHPPVSTDSMLYNNMTPSGHAPPSSMFHGVPNIASRPYDSFLDTYAMAATAMRPSVFGPSRDTVIPPVVGQDRATVDSLSPNPFSTSYSPYSSLRSPTTSSLPPSLNPSLASSTQLARNRCQVCISADSNGLHFGAKTCAACAAFFRRTISDKKKYSCKRTSRCVIHVTDTTGYRKICRNCRMKRCLEVGMLPENVQNKRQRIPPPPPRTCTSEQSALQTHLPCQMDNANMVFGSLSL